MVQGGHLPHTQCFQYRLWIPGYRGSTEELNVQFSGDLSRLLAQLGLGLTQQSGVTPTEL